ncbi:MAG: AGE family epimerase/isomerase, partial [Candidatus Bathyarchaeota archaeon]|nr:AGE family epimerase/isomerase [Candidatus Bathyarchaeota archaeon]
APKFPHSEALRLMLLQYRLQGHEAALKIVKKTLTHMYRGGVYDQQEGAFFRYSTTKDWSVPHYEKMCEDNAKLLVTFLEAYQFTGESVFKDAATGILGYVTSKLSDQQNGGFFGSQDADEVYYELGLSERKNRTAPRVDQTLYVNWNAMMVSGYLLAWAVLGKKSYRDFAFKTVDLLLDKAFSVKDGISHYVIDDKSFVRGLLSDQVFMARCLLDCYQVSSDQRFLDKAESLAKFMLGNLWDENGGFNDKPENGEAFGALKLLDKPLEENSVAAEVFLRLYHLTGTQRYVDVAKKTLDFFALNYQRYGVMGAVYGLAVEWFLHPMQVHVVGSKKSESTTRFLEQSLKAYYPIKVVEVVDPTQNKHRINKLGYQADNVARAYVCFGGSCNVVEDSTKIAEHIRGKTDGNKNGT